MSGPRYLRARGQAIWEAFEADELPAATQALIHETARLADTLDTLDAILGKRQTEWVRIERDEMGEIVLMVDGLLGERRQQAMAFKTLLQELRQQGVKEKTGERKDETNGRGATILNLRDRLG